MISLKELKAKALAATPGEWNHTHIFAGEEQFTGKQTGQHKWDPPCAVWTGDEVDARYIEAAQPQVVLALIEEIEAARAMRDTILFPNDYHPSIRAYDAIRKKNEGGK